MLSDEKMDLGKALRGNLNQSTPKINQFNLLIGSDATGKTSLLNSSQLTNIQTITDEKIEINSWHNRSAIFLELPEQVLNSQVLLKIFIKEIKKYRGKAGVDNILLCINIHSAMQQAPKLFVDYLKGIATKLLKLTKFYKKKVPLSLVFTHMDKMAGFCHSFDEQKGPWGYSFKPYVNKASLLKQNTTNNEILLKNLHASLIEKLHNNNDKLTRYLIREFPLQMESIGNLVNACVNHLSIDSVQTASIYFTCAQQSNSALDRLTPNISQTYSLSLKNQIPQSSLEKPYFIEGMLQEIETRIQSQPERITSRNKKYAAAVMGLFIIGLSTHHFLTTRQMNQAYKELTNFKQSKKDTFETLMPALEHLSRANQSLNKIHGTIPLNNFKILSNEISQQYSKGLNKTLLPSLVNQVSLVLTQPKSPSELYQALKAYLMLGNAAIMDKAYLSTWFNKFWLEHNLPHSNKLEALLNEALSTQFKGLNIDEQLVASTRSYLKSMPQSYLYFQLIRDYLPKDTHKITLFNFNLKEIFLPVYYEKAQLIDIQQKILPTISKQFVHDSYVLDNKGSNIGELIQSAFLENYKGFWQSISSKLRPGSFQNYQKGARVFEILSSQKSSIETLIQLIQKNTQAFINPKNDSEKAFNHITASQFTSTNLLSLSQIQSLRSLFSEFVVYFETLNNSNNKELAAFDISKKRFEQSLNDPLSRLMALEKQLPEPLNSWTKSLASNAWYLLLQDAQSHVNKQWHEAVYSQYKQLIFDKFPFSSNEKSEVSPEDFMLFFGHNGKLSLFFDTYLSPFIDTSTAKWVPKVKDGLQLPIQQSTIKELIRANLIKEMFFKYNNEKPSIKFTLHALQLEPFIQDLTIVMNGQELIETQENKRSLEFRWPGNDNQFVTKLNLNNVTGENFIEKEEGYWSWFKLLKKSHVEPYGEDMTNFKLTLNIKGNASQFLMITGTQMNPFIPGLLEHFNLPDKIA